MSQILGGVIESTAHRNGLPVMVVAGNESRYNVYLNPSIRPELEEPVGKDILFVEGEFLVQDKDLLFPNLIVLVDKNGLQDYKLCLGS